MTRVFVDTSVLLLASGAADPRREECQQFLRRCTAPDVLIHVSAEAIQEFVFHRMRRVERRTALAETERIRSASTVHAFDGAVIDHMLRLLAVTGLSGRDAVHAATAIVAGFDQIVSVDRDFDGIPGLSRIGPAEWGQA